MPHADCIDIVGETVCLVPPHHSTRIFLDHATKEEQRDGQGDVRIVITTQSS